jgi:hypothetical protein
MSQADLEGPSDPDAPPPTSGSEAAEPIVHVGGPWYDVTVDGETRRVRGRDAAEQALTDDPELSPQATAGETRSERFRGPDFSFRLETEPDPASVKVARHDGHTAAVNVNGKTVTRRGGHFGRGRWTVTYQPR